MNDRPRSHSLPPSRSSDSGNDQDADRMPPQLRAGKIVTDNNQIKWRIGTPIHLGESANIYTASEYDIQRISEIRDTEEKYVIKVERLMNHSLMKENMCYYAVAQTAQVQTWMVEKNMTSLPIPEYVNSGSYFSRTEKYRFLIIPRYGLDVQRLLLQQETMHIKPTCTIAYHIIDALEYLHCHGYVHGNITPGNIVLGLPIANRAPVYLLDFGEARRYPQGDIPIALGSASYGCASLCMSRDAHSLLVTRRGDVEMLGYNIVYFLTGYLPWEQDEGNYEEVAQKKNLAMQDVNNFLTSCFLKIGSRHPANLELYFNYLNGMESGDQPDYGHLKFLLKSAIEERNYRFDGTISFNDHARLQKRRGRQTRRVGGKRRRVAGNQMMQRRRLAANNVVQRRRLAANNVVQRRRLADAKRRQPREAPRQESTQEVAQLPQSTPTPQSKLSKLWCWIRSKF